MTNADHHVACVTAWLERAGNDRPSGELIQMLERALGALWGRTETALGTATLGAITDRVLYNAAERFPVLSSLRVAPKGGLDFDELRARAGSVVASELMPAIQFVLVEFLTVLGNLTAELLTPELHSELSKVAFPTRPEREDAGS